MDFGDLLLSLVSLVASGAMIFGGVVPYIPQYRSIQATRSSEGFSTFVCFILLVANILRILFWFVRPFELPLVAQSVLMIVAQLVMLHLCLQMRDVSKRHRFRDLDAAGFWNWSTFSDYVEFLTMFLAFTSMLTYLLHESDFYCEALGFVSLLTEAALGLPQWIENNRNKSTAGMSVTMVLCWLSGDIFKTSYFIAKAAPMQFSTCGALQICVDLAILWQVRAYSQAGHLPHSKR